MIDMGRHSYIGSYSEILFPEVHIGSFCSLANNITFHGESNHYSDGISTYPFNEELGWEEYHKGRYSKGEIVIGNDVWVGDGVSFLSGVTVGDGCVIGANTVVSKNLNPYGVYIGNPARLVRYRFSPGVIDLMLNIKWWDWSEHKIRKNIGKSVTEFVNEFGG
jgi:acetyltransferase-like isoleucine patch superfamily enzyme